MFSFYETTDFVHWDNNTVGLIDTLQTNVFEFQIQNTGTLDLEIGRIEIDDPAISFELPSIQALLGKSGNPHKMISGKRMDPMGS